MALTGEMDTGALWVLYNARPTTATDRHAKRWGSTGGVPEDAMTKFGIAFGWHW